MKLKKIMHLFIHVASNSNKFESKVRVKIA